MKKIVLFLLLFLPMLTTSKASPPLLETSENIVLNADNGSITIDFVLLDYNYLKESEVGILPHLPNVSDFYIDKVSVNYLIKEQKSIAEKFDYYKNSFLMTYKNISYNYNLNKKVIHCNSLNKWLMYS